MARNKAMRNFSLISVALHALIILSFTDIISARKPVRRIEVDLTQINEPARRCPQPKTPEKIQNPKIQIQNQQPISKEITYRKYPHTIVEPIRQIRYRPTSVAAIAFPKHHDFGQGEVHPLAYYLHLVKQKIEENKRYPLSARRSTIEGLVGLKFVILRDGRAKDVQIIQSSQHNILDEAALEAVKRANPFPPFPEEIEGSLLTVEVPIHFELIESM
jgi:protein TonB